MLSILSKNRFIEIKPGIFISGVSGYQIKEIDALPLSKSNNYFLFYIKFSEMSNEMAITLAPYRKNIGWLFFPIRKYDSFVDNPMDSIYSACLSTNNAFNSSIDYVLIKIKINGN